MKQKSHSMLWFMASFALVGALLSTWLAPKVISWYFNPPAQFGVNCVGPIEWAMNRFCNAQIAGIVIGGIVGFLLFHSFFRKRGDSVDE